MKLLVFFILFRLSLFAFEVPPSTALEIPMRDGEILAADLYLPFPDAKGLPCLLIRSPAGLKNPYALMYLPLLKEGYAIVIEETRSAKDKRGKTIPYASDGWGKEQDGYDTVAFLEKQPFTSGKIGTLGPSALGITQLMMAPTNPPGLKAQYIAFATADLYHHGLFQGGELYKHQVEGWLGLYAKDPDVYKTIYTQYSYSSFWDQFNMLPQAQTCRCPTLHIGGWYDVFLKGTLDSYVALQNHGGKGAKGKQKLVLGPWAHLWPFVKELGEYEYPKAALSPPFDISPEKWFAEHLKGENPENPLPTVLYYVMGPFDGSASSGNVWKTADAWPVPSTPTALYLGDEKTLDKNFSKETSFSYLYNPENPLPTIGGRNLFLPAGPFDQRPLEGRSDILCFTTKPLDQEVEITGDLKAVLFVNTSQEDTAFAVRLTDVYPDGKSLLIADGMARLSAVKKGDKPPYEVEIDLLSTSLVFAKGHQIRISVSSSNYPRFEKNLNTLKRIHENATPKIAENTLHVGKETPSRLILPVTNSWK